VNCAALPETLLESELYGYERGAFTGAQKKRRGKFEMAHEGVLFLDEIGDMPLSLQSKILHVLQSGEFSPLGSEHEIRTDAWVIAATNQQLEDKIKKKEFREDLFYRLNIIKIEIPPLRERPEDIPPLIDYYLRQYSAQFPDKEIQRPDRETLDRLCRFPWPGNIRQLQNSIKKQVVLNDWEQVISELNVTAMEPEPVNIPQAQATVLPARQPVQTCAPSFITEFFDVSKSADRLFEDISLKKIKKKAMDKVEREIISYVLEQVGWNRSKASRILKISYKTLLCKISELGIQAPGR
jgi:transcriptional regulator with PAS, ATPase and Fis domain